MSLCTNCTILDTLSARVWKSCPLMCEYELYRSAVDVLYSRLETLSTDNLYKSYSTRCTLVWSAKMWSTDIFIKIVQL
jgi:hypothetical protein